MIAAEITNTATSPAASSVKGRIVEAGEPPGSGAHSFPAGDDKLADRTW